MPILTYTSRRLRIFGRPKHITTLPAQAPPPPVGAAGAGGTKYLYYVSRRVRAQVRRKSLPISTVAPPPGLPGAGRTQFLYYTSHSLRTFTSRHHNKARYAFSGGVIPLPPTGELITDTTKLQLPINCILMGQQDYKVGPSEIESNDPNIKTRISVSHGGGGKISGSEPSFTVKKGNKGYD